MTTSFNTLRFSYPVCHNLKILPQTVSSVTSVTLDRRPQVIQIQSSFLRLYATGEQASKHSDLEEKKRKFQELEGDYKKLLNLEKLTSEEKRIHFLHAEAVARGHFTYDDPFLSEKVLTRLRHFLKGKCCGKSCRHCIYEHSGVVDEKKKALARFNSSFWVYDGGEEDLVEFDDQHVVTYGRGPYPRKYAQNAPQNMIKIYSKPKQS